MARQLCFDSSTRLAQHPGVDSFQVSTFPLSDRLRRLLWQVVWILCYRFSPRPLHAWRSWLLRCFGARLGRHCHFYPNVRIWAPWNLDCEDAVTAADGVEIYNPAPLRMGSHVILSQGAYLCGATHNCNDPAFPYLAFATEIGPWAWICARAMLSPGLRVGEGAVLGLGSVAVRDLDPWTIYAGNPAVPIKLRTNVRTG